MTRRTQQENTSDIYYLQQAVQELKKHAETSNEEVGQIKTDIALIKQEFCEMRKQMKSMSTRQWAVFILLLSTLLAVVFHVQL